MKKTYALLLVSLVAGAHAMAQYCSPTFVNGCTLWRNLSVSIGTINWTIGSTACTISNYTALSATLTPGAPEPMTVVSGNWTGCSVWIDLNSNSTFEDAENMFHSYVGGDPSYTYSFNVTVPAGTPAGTYRMRVIAPWGSDGYTPGSVNGFGPCGAYEYGNFDDFTVVVAGSTGIEGPGAISSIHASPNPTDGLFTLISDVNAPIELVTVTTLEGRMMRQMRMSTATSRVVIDLTPFPAGLYLVTSRTATDEHRIRVMKDR